MSKAEELYNKFHSARIEQNKASCAKRKPGISASDLGACNLKLQYKEWGFPITDTDSEEGIWRTGHGNAVHTFLQELSISSGISSIDFQEKRVETSYGIGGSIDDYWIEEKAVIDYKTIDSGALRYGNLPKEGHIRQVHAYMQGLQDEGIEASKAYIYYYPKGNNIKFKPKYHKDVVDSMPFTFNEKGEKTKCLVYEVPYDEKISLRNEVQVIDVKRACKKYEKLEGVYGDKKEGWQCRFCPFAQGCIGNKQAEFNKKLEELKNADS